MLLTKEKEMPRGYDNLSLNHGLLLHLTFEEGTGLITHDAAKPHHLHTLNGPPTWGYLPSGIPYLDISPNPDWIDCPAADTADLDFTTGDFSMVIWANPDSLFFPFVMVRGVGNTNGWAIRIMGDQLVFYTYQGGDFQATWSRSGIITTGIPSLLGISRSGTSVRTMYNGNDITFLANPHTDPVTANLKLHIGVANDEITGGFDGKIYGGRCGPRIWGRYLQLSEHKKIYNMEHHLVGV